MKHQIQFPPIAQHALAQDEEYFFLTEKNKQVKVKFHDYITIYKKPYLYEQLFYQRLQCNSPKKVVSNLKRVLANEKSSMNQLRVIDLGAGNGIVGEELQINSVSRLIGVDIVEEAKIAAQRDRPAIYDAYYVMDLSLASSEELKKLEQWHPNAMICVAALGFGDIPAKAFLNTLKSIAVKGWVAFNIQEKFLTQSDQSGFSELIKQLLTQQYLNIHHLERYQHRLSSNGQPIFYYSLICRKEKVIEQVIKE